MEAFAGDGVKLHVLTRKTLGGIQTDLDSRALDAHVHVVGLGTGGTGCSVHPSALEGIRHLPGRWIWSSVL